MIVLDTSVLSLAFRRRRRGHAEPAVAAQLRELIEHDYPLGVPGIVYQELLSGVRDPQQFARLQTALDGFVFILATLEHHALAARMANECRRNGIATSTGDCLIAATAVTATGQLFTVDTDFDRIAACTDLRLYQHAT